MHTAGAKEALHVLVLPSYYPTAYGPYSGTFFRDWAWALQSAGVTTGVAYVETRGLRTLSLAALRQTRFQLASETEAGLRDANTFMIRLRHFARNVILARDRSYGVNSTVTLSPGRILM